MREVNRFFFVDVCSGKSFALDESFSLTLNNTDTSYYDFKLKKTLRFNCKVFGMKAI